jgi:undecaprenyl pyrophosphate phosphatase UppP
MIFIFIYLLINTYLLGSMHENNQYKTFNLEYVINTIIVLLFGLVLIIPYNKIIVKYWFIASIFIFLKIKLRYYDNLNIDTINHIKIDVMSQIKQDNSFKSKIEKYLLNSIIKRNKQ